MYLVWLSFGTVCRFILIRSGRHGWHFDIGCKMLTKVPMGHAVVGLLEGKVDGKRDIARPVDGQLLGKEEGVLEGCMEGRGDG